MVIPLFRNKRRAIVFIVVLGHVGAIAGALYVGMAGVICTYIGGIWVIVVSLKKALQVSIHQIVKINRYLHIPLKVVKS